MKTFLGFTTGLLSGIFIGLGLMAWAYQDTEQNNSKEEA